MTSGILTATENLEAPLSWYFDLAEERQNAQVRCAEVLDDQTEGEVHVTPIVDRHSALYGFKPDTAYRCGVVLGDTSDASAMDSSTILELRTEPLPEGIAQLDISVPSDDPARTGYILVGVGNQETEGDFYAFDYDYTLVLDAAGHVRWYLNTYSTGSVDISFISPDVLGEPAFLWGGEGGEYVPPTIRDLHGETLFVATGDKADPTEAEGEVHHDAGLSQTRDSVFYLVNQDLPPEDYEAASWLGFMIKEVDLSTNEIRWSWDSFVDGVAIGGLEECTPEVTYYKDCFHANSITDRWETDPITGETRLFLYVGLRNKSRVMKIDYETREVLWNLGPYDGDFTLLEADGTPAETHRWFFYQHDAQRVGDRITVYDNGRDRQSNGGIWYTRVVELELDELNRTATIVYEYDELDPETGETTWQERVWGGYDLLPDGTRLLARGHCAANQACTNNDANDPSALLELAAGDVPQVAWRLDFREHNTALYRAERIDPCQLFRNASLCPEITDPLAPAVE